MKCFVAMAFHRDDTDRLYDTTLTEVLREKGITPIRVDRIEHNDDIDDRIVREIHEASFVIADLTYARPSVYYEAGFAEREIPVIYTVRRDHLSPSVDDEFGNHGVHFDLSMKNILDWSDPGDAIFRHRLASRIDIILLPILERLDASRETEQRREAFESLSTQEQSAAISAAASVILKKFGYLDYKSVGLEFDGRDEWYNFKDDYYYFVYFGYPEDTPRYVSERVDYNLNVGAALSRTKRIREQWIYATPGKAKLDEARRRLLRFNKRPGEPVFTQMNDLIVPLINPPFKGDVFLDWQNISRNVVERLWSGGEHRDGFRTKSPPMGSVHVQADIYRDFRFVYEGFQTRSVPRECSIHFIDEVASVEDFERRFDIIVRPGSGK